MNYLHTHARSRGFSLIELLIVVAVIALLSTVVISAIQITKNKGHDNSVRTTMKQMQVQAETYRSGAQHYGLGIASTGVTNCEGGLFDDPQVDNIEMGILRNAMPAATLSCTTDSDGNHWSMRVSELHGGGSWCIDNKGAYRAAPSNNGGECQ